MTTIKTGDIIRVKHERTIHGIVVKEMNRHGNLEIIWFNSPSLRTMTYPEHLVIKVS